jgi:hypothetical protein
MTTSGARGPRDAGDGDDSEAGAAGDGDDSEAGAAGDAGVGDEPDATPRRTVSAHESRPGKVVFTEEGNADGWISTDTTLDVRE